MLFVEENTANLIITDDGRFCGPTKRRKYYFHYACARCGYPFLGHKNNRYCSPRCSKLSVETATKSKQTCILKYGTESYSHTDEYKERVKQTNLKLYGVDNYTKTTRFKLKQKDWYMRHNRNRWCDIIKMFEAENYKVLTTMETYRN